MAPTTAHPPKRLHYAWVVAGLTFVVMLVAAGVRAAPAVLIVPLELEFGWSRATISFALSISLLLYGLLSPFGAALLDSLGARRTMGLSLTAVAAGIALTPLMTASWHLVVLWGIVVGAGTGMIALVLGAMVANRWFVRHRGLVMGLFSASAAAGQLVFLPLLAALVGSLGWRLSSLGVAAAALLVVPFVVLLMRDRPADVGLLPYGATQPPPDAVKIGNPVLQALIELREGLRSRDFWLLAGTFFVCGASTSGLIGTHLIPACIDRGIPDVQAAGLVAGMGIFNVIGTTASGWLSDRWDSRWLLAWYYGLRGLSLIALPFAMDSFIGLSLFAIFYGLDWIATVPPTVRLTANSFGPARAGILFGWIFAAHQLGAAAIAWAAGVIRVELDDYLLAFLFAGILCFAATAMALMIGRRPGAAEPALVAEAAA